MTNSQTVFRKWFRKLFGKEDGEVGPKPNWKRYREYPTEPKKHEGHHRCTTHARNVNYCYDCGHHYRPRGVFRHD